ncbi:MAG: hypothetical protein EBU01_11145 [Crocinitomicaceae bacterium]|nr:hypothetical protein [Crocinitomicaceae bacterium]
MVNNVTASTTNLGSTRGKGSSTRILNTCLQTSDNNEDKCISIFLAAPVDPPLPTTGILFNVASFDKWFSKTTGFPTDPPADPKYFQPIPPPIKESLILAVNRWKPYLEFNPEMVNLIRSLAEPPENRKTLKRWNGLSLIYFAMVNYEDPTTLAGANPFYVSKTSMNIYFSLTVNKNLINDGKLTVPQDYFVTILTHELGHALGMPIIMDLVDGSGVEILPKTQTSGTLAYDKDYQFLPQAYLKPYYKKAVDAKYAAMKLEASEKEAILFQAKMETLQASPERSKLLINEKNEIRKQIDLLKKEIMQLENNLGFFAKSKGADQLRKDVETKVASANNKIESLKRKLKLIPNE